MSMFLTAHPFSPFLSSKFRSWVVFTLETSAFFKLGLIQLHSRRAHLIKQFHGTSHIASDRNLGKPMLKCQAAFDVSTLRPSAVDTLHIQGNFVCTGHTLSPSFCNKPLENPEVLRKKLYIYIIIYINNIYI